MTSNIKTDNNMQFKTNAKCGGCSATITGAVRTLFPEAQLSLDLASPDKVLAVQGLPETDETAERIVKAIAAAGFQASRI